MAEQQNPRTKLGEGSVGRLLVGLALPTVAAQVINMLYNVVDRIYIGRMEGTGGNALTGVGLCFAIIMLISAFAALVGTGGAPRASIAMGQQRNDKAEEILGNCFSTLLLLAVVLTIVFEAFAEPMLRAFGGSENTIPYALDYLRIYVLGSVFVMTVLGMNLFITSQGFTKFSMLTTLIGAVCNIILDPILIFGLGLGVKGAAIATVVSQAISCVWVLRFLTGNRTILRLRLKNMHIRAEILLPCLALGVSPFVMQSTEAALNISFNSSLFRYGGDIAVGSMTIITSCMQLVFLPLSGLSQGAQPLLSYNFGARKNDRVKQAFRYLFTVCVSVSCLFFLISELFPQVLVGIFTPEPELIRYASWALRIYMGGLFMSGVQNACQQSFVALGQAKISLLLACLRKLVLLIPLIFLLPNFFADKVFAVFLAEPVSDILAATVTGALFFTRFDRILEQGPAQR